MRLSTRCNKLYLPVGRLCIADGACWSSVTGESLAEDALPPQLTKPRLLATIQWPLLVRGVAYRRGYLQGNDTKVRHCGRNGHQRCADDLLCVGLGRAEKCKRNQSAWFFLSSSASFYNKPATTGRLDCAHAQPGWAPRREPSRVQIRAPIRAHRRAT